MKLSRRSAMGAASAVAVGTAVLRGAAASQEPQSPKLWPLEGELRVHPKFLYRYYLVFGDGQKCALYRPDHGREMDQLARLKLPVRVRVSGMLGTEHFPGGTEENPSPFGATWTLYMDVHEVAVLK